MKHRVGIWVFTACLAAGAGILAWLSSLMLALEQRERCARRDLDRELEIRDVLWRMDAWLAPILAQEVQRPPEQYIPFNTLSESYTNRLARLEPGQVVVPSPLLGFRSDLFPLHFNLTADGVLTSPQVPLGNELDVVQSREGGTATDRPRVWLERIRGRLDHGRILETCKALGSTKAAVGQPLSDYERRAQSTVAARRGAAQWIAPPQPSTTTPEPLTPMWIEDMGEKLLVFVRSTRLAGEATVQGFVADWDELAASLLAEVVDSPVARDATLIPVDVTRYGPAPTDAARRLTTVPAALATGPTPALAASWTPVCSLLALAWIAFGLVAVTVGFTLRQAIAFGDRRARFASAVAHELRTPLTTFRMYTDLLSSGMVEDPAKREEYFATLSSESDRLARLVENVLGYARIEDGRFAVRRERVSVQALVDRHAEVLGRRCAESDRTLRIEFDPEVGSREAETDGDAVGQILFNLVDNACKYGDGDVVLDARLAAGGTDRVEITVRDFGSGIARADATRIFLAFGRGREHADDGRLPGVGLGLALSRALARDLGGELSFENADPGARFVLALPTPV